MKKISVLLLIAFLAIKVFAQSEADTKLLIFKLTPKSSNTTLFEQKMAAFAKMFMVGDNQYRVQQVYGGVNDGTYIMSRTKVTSWAFYDDEKNGKADKAFWDAFNRDINPLLEKYQGEMLEFRKDLSSVNQKIYADKNTSTQRDVKPDKINQFETLIKKIKPAWEKCNFNIAVYKSSTGNPNRYYFIRRHPNGWKEKDAGGTLLKDEFIKMYSQAEWDDFGKNINECVESVNIQLQHYRKNLSGK
jgi:hypothetical protein